MIMHCDLREAAWRTCAMNVTVLVTFTKTCTRLYASSFLDVSMIVGHFSEKGDVSPGMDVCMYVYKQAAAHKKTRIH